jgi:hypothetical protein
MPSCTSALPGTHPTSCAVTWKLSVPPSSRKAPGNSSRRNCTHAIEACEPSSDGWRVSLHSAVLVRTLGTRHFTVERVSKVYFDNSLDKLFHRIGTCTLRNVGISGINTRKNTLLYPVNWLSHCLQTAIRTKCRESKGDRTRSSSV